MLILPCLLSLAVFIQGSRASCQLGDDVIKLTSWQGEFSSPGHGQGQYPNNQQCQWEVKVSQGSRVKVSFLTFDLEDGYYANAAPSPDNLKCNDEVKVMDGDGVTVLFQGCQSQGEGQTFESTSNRMSVFFVSDESDGKAGFNATYEGICQVSLSQSGFLESPGYPDPPPEGVSCEWEVTSSQGQIIYIRPDKKDANHVLPDCNTHLLKWQTTGIGGAQITERELCRNDSKIVTQSDVIVTYEPTSANRWTGRLFLDFSTQSGCEQYCEHGFTCLDSKTMNIGDYRCLCQPPYQGRNCEVYTDPCTLHNCSHAGLCTPVPESVDFNCDCNPGFSGQRCEVKLPDPCESVTCQHGGTCRAEVDTAQVTCLCAPDYTGTHCAIPVGEGHCRAEVDKTPGSGISWTDTLAGHHDNRPCPGGVRGRAERHCMKDKRSPTGAVWKRPDLSNCTSAQLHTITVEAQTLRQSGVSGDVLYNVTRQLDNVTSELITSGGGVYPGDLLGASDVLDDISRGVMTAASVHQDPPGLAQHFTSSISNILRPDTLHVWGNAKADLVETKVASILTSARRFAENLVKRQNGQNVITGLTSSEDASSTLLRTSVDHVELVVSEWGTENTTWTPPFPPQSPTSGATSTSTTSLPGNMAPVPSHGTSRASITLPPDLLDIAKADGSGRTVKVYTGRFSTMGPLLSLKEERYTRPEDVPVHRVVNSDVLSAEVLDIPASAFSYLSRPVVLIFPLTDPDKGDDLDKYCVFMNMSASPAERWLREGCHVFESNTSHVTCYCYHLTNFAVLLDVYDQADNLDDANSAALSYITYIGGSLSILSCIVVIVVFEYFRLRSDRVRIHEQLALSIMAVQVLFFIGVANDTGDGQAIPQWGCKVVSILLHYSLTALFCWMLVEGIHLYLQLVRVFKQPSHLAKYTAVGWGVPLLVVGISVGIFFDKYGENNRCWLQREVLLVCFVPTVSLVIVVNVVILVLVIRIMLRSLQSTAKANANNTSTIRSGAKACLVLLPLLGLTWVLGFLAVGGKGQQEVTVYVFTYLFTITNSCQGLLFFLFHCLLNADVHNAYERKYRQRRRTLSSLEPPTRKNSETSTYMTDISSRRKSTTKTILSDVSVLSVRRPSLAHHRFLLYDQPPPHPLNPHLPPHTHPHTAGSDSDDAHVTLALRGSRGAADGFDSLSDDMQASDKEIIWRRTSVNQDNDHNHYSTAASFPGYPNSPSRDVSAFVTSMHNVLDRPARNSVRFSDD